MHLREPDVVVVEPSAISLEDASSLAVALESALESCSITSVETLTEAHAAITADIDCVFTAEAVADGSGLELLEWLADHELDVPVVLAPLAGSEALAGEAIGAGVADYVPRPADPNELRTALERALEPQHDGLGAEPLTALRSFVEEVAEADTPETIAELTVETAPTVAGLAVAGVYLFDTAELRLAASTGPSEFAATAPATSESPVGRTFVEDERRFLEDERYAGDDGLRSRAYLPLAEEGVLAVGAPTANAFDDATRERIELLAAATTMALVRLESEESVHDQRRELSRRTEQRDRLERATDVLRGVTEAIVHTSTRQSLERTVCAELVDRGRFAFAWIAELDSDENHLEPRAHGGSGGQYLDTVTGSFDAGVAEPTVRTSRTGSTTVVPNVAERLQQEPWRERALTQELQSAISVPLSVGGFSYGVLTVYDDSPESFDEELASILEEAGETIATAIAGRRRTEALLTSSRTRLELEVTDESFLFHRLAKRANCTVSFDGGVRRHADGTAVSLIVSVTGTQVSEIVSIASEFVSVTDAMVVETDSSTDTAGGTLLLELSTPFLPTELAFHGVVLESVSASPDGAILTVDVPEEIDVRVPTRLLTNRLASVELRSKRTIERTSVSDLQTKLHDAVTERQLEVVKTAYEEGFFESPRDRTGDEIAQTLGISAAAFYRHNRSVQRTLFSMLFEGTEEPAR